MSAPVDQNVRQQALDPSQSFIVQAPAGSGKTELLTRRVLTLLCTVNEPEEILAITFTRKAASEMRQRVVETLERASGSPATTDPYELEGLALAKKVLERDVQSGWQLIRNPQRLNLRTIDSLATQLAHRLPVTSTLGAPTGLVENADALYQEAARRFLQQNLESLDLVLLHLGNKLDRAQSLLAGLLAKRDQWKRHVYSAGNEHEKLRKVLEHMLGELVSSRLENLRSLIPAGLETTLLPCLSKAAEFALIAAEGDVDELGWEMQLWPDMDELPGSEICDLELWGSVAFAVLTTQNGVRKRLTKKEGFPPKGDAKKLGVAPAELEQHKQNMMDALAMLEQSSSKQSALKESSTFVDALVEVRKLPAPFYKDDQWALLSQLLTVLPDLLLELQLVFAEHAVVDFGEISARAALALGSEDVPTDLALSMDLSLTHLLVDEFQDTSQTQFRLFEQLVAPWEAGDGRTFFAVGDPMQSIYRFREGDVALFTQVQESGIGNVNVTPLTLSVNFRAAPAVTDWVNSTFGKIFPAHADADTGAVPYAESKPYRDYEGQVQVHPMVDADKSAEAECVARLCSDAIQGNPRHTVAILVRSRAQAVDIFAALRDQGLAYESVDMDLVGERAVVRDLVALTLALRYPHDRLHWFSLLRAPFVGLTLHDLHALMHEADRKAAVIERLQDTRVTTQLSEDGQQRVQRLLNVIEPAMERVTRSRLMPWVEAVWLQLGGPVVCESDTDRDAANRAIALLFQLEAQGDLWQKSAIDAALARLYAAASDSEHCQIQVMTLHKSKGLEFDTVILPALDRRPRGDSTQLLNWFESTLDGEPQLLLAPFEQSGVHPNQRDRINKLVQRAAERCNDQEKLRLLYVACTRAKHQLHLVARASINTMGELTTPTSASLLAPLWPLVKQDFERVGERAGDKADTQGNDQYDRAELDIAVKESLQEDPLQGSQESSQKGAQHGSHAGSQNGSQGGSQEGSQPVPPLQRQGQLDLIGFDDDDPLSTGDALTHAPLQAPPLLRLSSASRLPVFAPFKWQTLPDQMPDKSANKIEFTWAGRDARDIGTVIHDQLQMLADRPESVQAMDEGTQVMVIRRQLKNLGLNDSRLETATSRVMTALQNTLQDERGRWILQHHAQAQSEWALTVPKGQPVHEGATDVNASSLAPVQQVIIDRTFVDSDGIRWIVDYKTGDHEGGNKEAFLDREKERYADQLDRYADIMKRIDDRPVRVGLYFPMLRGWREWEP